MRITLASLHPRPFSGQIHSLRALAKVLGDTGDDVTLRMVSAPGPGSHCRADGLVGHAIGMLSLLRSLARDVDGTDLVHLNLPTPGFSLLGDWLAARIRVPVVVGYEAPLVTGSVLRSVAREAGSDPRFYLPRLIANNQLVAAASPYRAAAYVVSSNYQKDQLLRIGVKARIAVIPNVVEVPDEDGDTPYAAPIGRAELGLPEQAQLVGYVGHFHPVKGVETLVSAFGQLRDRLPQAKLVLAWSGLGNRDAIERRLAEANILDRVIWIGRTNLPAFLRSLDALALPYRLPIGQNAFPNLLLEAQGIGVPLVSSQIPVVSEACQTPGTALLVPPGQPTALANALAGLIDNEIVQSAMVRQQKRQFERRFAPEVLAYRYRALYRGVLGIAGHKVELRRRAPARVGAALKAR
jgi:glycosyltransferase involved in cell wall biosynthesis